MPSQNLGSVSCSEGWSSQEEGTPLVLLLCLPLSEHFSLRGEEVDWYIANRGSIIANRGGIIISNSGRIIIIIVVLKCWNHEHTHILGMAYSGGTPLN